MFTLYLLRKMQFHFLTSLALLAVLPATTVALYAPCLNQAGHDSGEGCQGFNQFWTCTNSGKHTVSSTCPDHNLASNAFVGFLCAIRLANTSPL
jgi:hypothetical protein